MICIEEQSSQDAVFREQVTRLAWLGARYKATIMQII
jgi:hypothetical protein